jgi:hypothetical protein
MTCAEFQKVLPEMLEGDRNTEHAAHLASCSACSDLISDLKAISEAARQLRASDEPSPRVWNALEIDLRREGLIRQPQRKPASVLSRRRWPLAWIVPAMAALLVGFGILTYQRGSNQPSEAARNEAPAAPSVAIIPASTSPKTRISGEDDQQLLEAVGTRSPEVRAQYAADLNHVNSYIEDAEQSAQSDPNDEDAQQSLLNAYDQRAMLYQMALDRSLP